MNVGSELNQTATPLFASYPFGRGMIYALLWCHPIHRGIVGLKCPLIYTTNYDRWLEIAYERSEKEFV
jgi:hypothetical protein